MWYAFCSIETSETPALIIAFNRGTEGIKEVKFGMFMPIILRALLIGLKKQKRNVKMN